MDDDTVASSVPNAAGPIEMPPVIAGRYEIVRWLGGGGMGRVYEAMDRELGERVALKMLHAALPAEAIERFRREVKLTRRIQHRNVARMFDIGDHAGEKFLTMELVGGESLARVMASRGRPMGWHALRPLAMQLCAGLAAAHGAGVIHRDLKPDNVLVERGTERAVITDFGIARSGADASVTQTGAIMGTPRYMAPEQLAGGHVDARADLFSLGVMLFELASFQRPWSGDGPIAMAVAMATEAPAPLVAPALPAAVAHVIMQCLAQDPAERPISAAAIADVFAAQPVEMATPPLGVPTVQTSAVTPAVAYTSLAVLPFSAAPADQYLAEGIREDLVDSLSTTPTLRVRPTGTVGPAAVQQEAQEVGRALEVDHVVAGAVRRTPAGLRVAVRLIGVADGFQIWAHRADTTEADVLSLADQLGRGIAKALSAVSASHTQTERPMDPRAVELYLRARAEVRRFWGEHALKAVELLREAAAISPDAPAIIAALAFAETQAWLKTSDPARLPIARAAVQRALATHTGEAYVASANLRANEGDLVAGVADLLRALHLAPMSAHAHELAGRVLVESGAVDEGRHHFENAKALDPSRESTIEPELARLDALAGDWDGAAARLTKLTADPDPAIAQLGAMFEARLAGWRGDLAQITRSFAKLQPRLSRAMPQIGQVLVTWISLGKFDRALWDQVNAVMYLPDQPRRLQLVSAQRAIELAMLVGEPDLALAALHEAIEHGLVDIVWLDGCPLFAQTVADSRWQAARMRLASEASHVLAAFRAGTR
ncbi:MAG TPA: protein kinase [Kofleriaceae bacterium]